MAQKASNLPTRNDGQPYFAGMLTGLRQARWYGSRAIGIAAAVVCSHLVASSLEFWQAAIWTVLCALIFGTAAWGGFLTTGTYRAQPKIAKVSLGIVLFFGFMQIGNVGAQFVLSLTEGSFQVTIDEYAILKDGRIVLTKSDETGITSVTDLDGKPLSFPKEKLWDFHREELHCITFKQPPSAFEGMLSYRQTERIFSILFENPGTRWFYVHQKSLFQGYSIRTRKLAGVIGINGFSPDERGSVKRFDGPLKGNRWNEGGRVFRFPQSVYCIDRVQQKVFPLFVANQVREIIGAGYIGDYYVPEGEDVAMVATDQQIQAWSLKGQLLFESPNHYQHPYDQIDATLTPKGDRYFLWYRSPSRNDDENNPALPSYIVELSNTGQVLKQNILPPLPQRKANIPWIDHTWMATSYLGLSLGEDGCFFVRLKLGDPWAVRVYKYWKFERNFYWIFFSIQCAVGFLCSSIVLGVARINSFGRKNTWIWSVIVFFTGPAGFLTFVCIQEWPTKETCPSCGKKRVVNRDHCEHCDAEFLMPGRDGTEIFEVP